MRRWLRPWVVVLLVGLAYVGGTLVRHGGDPLAFALVGTQYSQGAPQGTQGYDGQFAYFIARDPAGGWCFCDVPAYRYQRVLYSLLAWVLIALVRDLLRGWQHPWVAVLLAQAAVLPFLPFSTWREPMAMARLATGLVAATLLYGALRRSRRVLVFSLAWLATLALLVNESVLPV